MLEIRGKWGGGASSVDTPVEDERQPLFKTSWSRSPDTALDGTLNFWVPIACWPAERDWCTA